MWLKKANYKVILEHEFPKTMIYGLLLEITDKYLPQGRKGR